MDNSKQGTLTPASVPPGHADPEGQTRKPASPRPLHAGASQPTPAWATCQPARASPLVPSSGSPPSPHPPQIMQLLVKGNRQRTQEPTAANRTSSRSHAVLQVAVRQRSRVKSVLQEVRQGRLFMIDLAGSERASQVRRAPRAGTEGCGRGAGGEGGILGWGSFPGAFMGSGGGGWGFIRGRKRAAGERGAGEGTNGPR